MIDDDLPVENGGFGVTPMAQNSWWVIPVVNGGSGAVKRAIRYSCCRKTSVKN